MNGSMDVKNNEVSTSFHSNTSSMHSDGDDDESHKSLESGTHKSFMSYYSSYSGYDENNTSNHSSHDDSYDNPVVASKEQKAVILARVVVVVVLIIALAATASTMFWVAAKNERTEFQTQVRNKKSMRWDDMAVTDSYPISKHSQFAFQSLPP